MIGICPIAESNAYNSVEEALSRAATLPGDVMVMTGKVQAKQAESVVVEVVGKNAWGNHVTAKSELSLSR